MFYIPINIGDLFNDPLIYYKGRSESTLQEVLFPQPDISLTLSIQR